jgi:hypothetical protein
MSNMITLRLSLMLWAGLLASVSSWAQCSDSSTLHYAVDGLSRTASNNVRAVIGTQTVGDYSDYWDASVTGTEHVGSTLIHSGSDSVSWGGNDVGGYPGTIAGWYWNDAPSTTGAGSYTTSSSHEADSLCSDVLTATNSASLTVNKPSISGPNAVWYLGNGQYQTGYSYLTNLTAVTNCGGSDTCSDTPSWTVSGNSSEISLQCSPCVNQTVTAQARSDSYQDIDITISIGGFSSDPMPFSVYAPYSIICCYATTDSPISDGFATFLYLNLYDRWGDNLTGLAVNESFSSGDIGDFLGFSGWSTPMAGGKPAGWASFYDLDFAYGGCSSVTPQCTNPQIPTLSTTAAMHVLQSWQAGSANSGQGVQVRTDWIQYYVDHARHTHEVSPSAP